MTRIAHVRQEDAYGCGVACLAMITGTPYREVRAWFRERAWQNARHDGRVLEGAARETVEPHDFTRWGLDHFVMEHYLAEHGYATARLFAMAWPDGPRPVWPPAPFAPAHLAQVRTPIGGHYVVWLPDGRVLDPAAGETTLGTFREIEHVLGVCRMGARL